MSTHGLGKALIDRVMSPWDVVCLRRHSLTSYAHDRSNPECENCHAQMATLGKLSASLAKPAIKVFRCYGCNGVKTYPEFQLIPRIHATAMQAKHL